MLDAHNRAPCRISADRKYERYFANDHCCFSRVIPPFHYAPKQSENRPSPLPLHFELFLFPSKHGSKTTAPVKPPGVPAELLRTASPRTSGNYPSTHSGE